MPPPDGTLGGSARIKNPAVGAQAARPKNSCVGVCVQAPGVFFSNFEFAVSFIYRTVPFKGMNAPLVATLPRLYPATSGAPISDACSASPALAAPASTATAPAPPAR